MLGPNISHSMGAGSFPEIKLPRREAGQYLMPRLRLHSAVLCLLSTSCLLPGMVWGDVVLCGGVLVKYLQHFGNYIQQLQCG